MNKNYKFGDFYLETNSRSLFNQSKLNRLSPRAFKILLLLITKQGEAVGKNEIIDTVWADSFVEENNLAVHISALRRVLGENISGTKYIETISGYGYRFLPAVEEVDTDIFSALRQNQSSENAEPRSLAILPFANKTGSVEFDYLSEGITEGLIMNLSQLSQLKVIAHSAVSHYKEQAADLQETGFLLGVEAILIGKIFEFDKTLEISVELLKVSDLSHIWGMRYECQFEDFLKTRTDISIAIADKLHLEITKPQMSQLTKQPTKDSEAYKLYLRAWNFAEKKTKQGLLKGIKYYNEALKLDGKFALAYAGIAEAYINLGHFFLIPTDEAISNAQNAIRKALSLHADLSEIHAAKGLLELYNLNLKDSEKSFRRALKLNPNNSSAHSYYSIYLVAVGNFPLSLTHQYKAIELNPFISSRMGALSTRFYLMREYSKAIKTAEEVLELFPNNDLLYANMALAHAHLGLSDSALKNIQIAYEMEQRSDVYAHKGYIYALFGDRKESYTILNDIKSTEYHDPIDFCDIAVIYVALGDNDKAFEYLEKAYESKFSHLFLLKVDPRFDSLRSDPRFEPLLKRIGFE